MAAYRSQLVSQVSDSSHKFRAQSFRLPVLLLGRLWPINSLVAPCHAGASHRQPTSHLRDTPLGSVGTRRWIPLALALALVLSALSTGWPAIVQSQALPDGETRARDVGELLSLSEALSQGLAATVGTAISPLVGIAAISAFGYFRADSDERGQLPWYNQPQFWLWATGILMLVAAKDTIGGAMPLIKKPLDALELLENQLSALVALPIVIPTLVGLFERTLTGLPTASWLVPVVYAAQETSGTGSVAGNILGWLVITVLATVIFVIVWFTGHVANVLVFLNPIPFVDTFIKSARLALIGVVVISAALSPTLGIVLAAAVFLVCCWLFGWSFRLTHLGMLMAWDIVMRRGSSLEPDGGKASDLRGFSAASLRGVPPRTYGHLHRSPDGQLVFRYRRFLVLREQTLVLHPGAYAIGTGFVSPTLVEVREGSALAVRVRFLPRYRDDAAALARVLKLENVRDAPLPGRLRDVAQSI